MEWIFEVSRASSKLGSGRMLGSRRDQHGLSASRGPREEDVMPTGRSDFEGSFYAVLPPDFGEILFIKVVLTEKFFPVYDTGRKDFIVTQKIDNLAEMAGTVYAEPH